MTSSQLLFYRQRVEADSVEDFLSRYYKPERYIGRGEEYAQSLLRSYQNEFEQEDFAFISRHDSVTGKAVAFFGGRQNELRIL